MFGKKNYKKIIITLLAISMIFGTVALAADGIYSKKLNATFGRVKFNYEGKDVTKDVESKYGTPGFTVNDRAYVPVRGLADLLGVEVDYDHESHTAKMTDKKVDREVLEKKDQEIARLKKELAKLEDVKEEIKEKEEEKKEEKNVKESLASLKTDINKRYREYEQVDFNVNLSESKETISIQINTDLALARDRQNWIRMRHVDKKYMIEDIVGRVRKELPKFDITGYIYDSSSRDNLYTFNQKQNANLTIANRDHIGDDRYYDDGSIYDEVDYQFRREGIRNAKLTWLRGSDKDRIIDFEIEFPESYKADWKRLSERDIEYMLDYIAEEIEYEYKDVQDIYGKIYMERELVGEYDKRYKDSSGYFKKIKY